MMASEFRTFTLGEVAHIIGGGTPPTKDPANFNGDIPWITPKDLSSHSYRYIQSGKRSITNQGLSASSAKILPANSVLFSSRAPIGYVALAKNELTTNQGFKNLVLKEGNVPEYFYYLLKKYTPKIKSFASGSTFQEVSSSALKSIEVMIPDEPTQRAIAHILGTLDDKVELNQRMNQTLEEIAKAIFKSWFVDFDPVCAKAEGRPTDLPLEISALFPDEWVESEVGRIPKGWTITPLDAIGIFRNGLALQKYPYIKGQEKLPVVKIAQLRKGNTTGDELYASGVPKDYIIDDGDFVFSWSASLLAKYWVGNRGALNQHLFKVEGKGFPLWFISGWVQKFMPEFQSIAASKATTMGHIKREHLKQALCAVPDSFLLEEAGKIISPIIEKTILAEKESRVLGELRDTLLPKLISGELRIPDTEKFLKEAGI